MATTGDGTVSMDSLKTRMQEVAQELEKYRELYTASEKELTEEKIKTRAVLHIMIIFAEIEIFNIFY